MNIPRKWFWLIVVTLVAATASVWVRYYLVHSGQWQPVAEGVVLTRDFKLSNDAGLRKLPDSLRLGEIEAREVPKWWLQVAKNFGLEGISQDLPLVFCGELSPPAGGTFTVVAQLSAPPVPEVKEATPPELGLQVTVVERLGPFSAPRLVSISNRPLGPLPDIRVHSGKITGPSTCQILVETRESSTAAAGSPKTFTLSLDNDGKVKVTSAN